MLKRGTRIKVEGEVFYVDFGYEEGGSVFYIVSLPGGEHVGRTIPEGEIEK